MAVQSIWDKFDEAIDTEGLVQDVKAAAENGTGSYKEVPHGTYEVEVNKMELITSKAGDPMVSIWFKVLEGEFKGSLIFYNQVVTQGFQIHLANELLRNMDTEIDIEFKSYGQYAQMIMDIHEAVDEKLEFVLDYTKGKKGFSNYAIKEVFEV